MIMYDESGRTKKAISSYEDSHLLLYLLGCNIRGRGITYGAVPPWSSDDCDR
jgi:hypothetical protein